MVSLSASLGADEAARRDMRITSFNGPVTLRTAEEPRTPALLSEETPLNEGDVIETGPHAEAEIILEGQSVFRLQSNSKLKIRFLYVKNTQLEMKVGSFLAKIKSSPETEGIIVKLPTAVLAIRGTELAAATAPGISYVGVFEEGKVAVAGAWGHEHVIVGPHQETQVPLSNVPAPPHKLIHFTKYRSGMIALRKRTAYWRAKWKPLAPGQKAVIRLRLKSK